MSFVEIKPFKCVVKNEEFYVNFNQNGSEISDHLMGDGKIEVKFDFDKESNPYFVVYVTDLCNMNCEYCFNKMGEIKRNHSTPRYLIDELIDFFRQLEQEEINIRFFGGEPTLNKKWIYECIQKLNREGKKYNYNIFTNLLVYDEEFIDYLILNNSQFFVSLGTDKEEEKGEKYGSTVILNATKLAKKTKNIIGSLVWTPKSNCSLVESIRKNLKTGIKYYSILVAWGGRYDNQVLEEFSKTLEEFAEYYIEEFLNHRTEHLMINPFIGYIKLMVCGGKGAIDACGAGKCLAAISTDGVIYPCHDFSVHKGYEQGNIRKQNWNQRFKKISAGDCIPCKECQIKYICRGRCYAHNYLVNKDILMADTLRCEMEKKIIMCSAYIVKSIRQHPAEYAVLQKILKMDLRENVEH